MPGVAVHLGGQTRHLLYDLNALCELKGQGINLLAANQDKDTEDPTVLRALLWAGFLHETPDLRVEQVGRWVTMDRIAELADTFALALSGSVQPQSPDGIAAAASSPPPAPVVVAVTDGETATGLATVSSD